MKSLSIFFILSVALCQVFEVSTAKGHRPPLTVTVFYETLCMDNTGLFEVIADVANNPILSEYVYFDMVPFGKANFTEDPFSITCQHGPLECYGNVMNACFMAKYLENSVQTEFVACCMASRYPPYAGKRCAKKLGYNFRAVKRCTEDDEGIQLQIENGYKTYEYMPDITSIPAVAINDEMISEEEEDLSDLKGIIIRKLKDKGILF